MRVARHPTGITIQPLPRTVRQVWLALHVVCSVGWLGLLAAAITLSVTGIATADRSLYRATVVLGDTLFVPVTLLVLVTGVVLGIGTKWGLLRFYWVASKLVIGLALFVAATTALRSSLDATEAGDASGSVALMCALAVLTVVAEVLSIIKPWGRIRPKQTLEHT